MPKPPRKLLLRKPAPAEPLGYLELRSRQYGIISKLRNIQVEIRNLLEEIQQRGVRPDVSSELEDDIPF
jgi:hypothetical protein